MMKSVLVMAMLCSAMSAQVRKETLAQLEKVTAAKHLHFVIACTSSEDAVQEEFLAYANIPGHDSLRCIEEGGKPEWVVTENRTQQQAAERLLQALEHGPTVYPDHCEPPKKIHKHRQCPPRIEGGSY